MAKGKNKPTGPLFGSIFQFDSKFHLLNSSRDIIRFFGGRVGVTKDGPLTKFAASVFKYGTGMQEKFNRQVLKIPAYEKWLDTLEAQVKAQRGEK